MNLIKLSILSIFLITALSFNVKAQSSALSAPVNTVIDDYIALKNALATGDGNAATAKAKDLLAAISEVPEKSMDAKQLKLWSAYKEKLKFDSRHITEVSMVHHQREHFAGLSNNLYAVLKGFKLNKAVLYREYCDMKQQYFLSETSTGKDPYMGMNGCSKVKETLPAQ